MMDGHTYEGYLSDFDFLEDALDLEGLRGRVVFLTGACGLIGSCLAEAILHLSHTQGLGTRVLLGARDIGRLVDRFRYWEGFYVPVVYNAMSSESPDEPIDYVFHCASNAHPGAYTSQPVETAMTNVLGTYNLLSKLARDGRGRMVYVSSSEVYGRRSSAEPYREGDCFPVDSLDPRSCYPVSKRMAENLCSSFVVEYGVDSVIVRPGHVFGPTQTPSDDRAHAQFAREAAAGRPVVMKSAGTQFRSYCYVADCASAMLYVALSGEQGEAYNIANPDSDCTIAELARVMADAGGVELVRAEATAGEKRGYARMDNSALDSTKLRSLGWRGSFSLERGAVRTIELLRSAFSDL